MKPKAKSIALSGVGKTFGTTRAVHPTDLKIERGEFLTLLGPSGCGKTTLLRMIAGLESTSVGKILIDDEDVTSVSPRHRDVAIMFQDYALFPHMTVIDNVAYGLKMRGQGLLQRRKNALDWLSRLELEPMADRLPDALSGGQRQRVALARALITEPGALLLDEPLSALDANLRTQLRGELRRIHRDVGTTFVCVTHDQEEAMTLSDRIVVLNDGKIAQIGTPDQLYGTPASAFVAQFFGRCTLWPAIVKDASAGLTNLIANGLPVRAKGDFSEGQPVSLVLRPESLEICDAHTGDMDGVVSDVVKRGPVADVAMSLDCGLSAELEVSRHTTALPVPGDRAGVRIRDTVLAALATDQ